MSFSAASASAYRAFTLAETETHLYSDEVCRVVISAETETHLYSDEACCYADIG